MDSLVFYIECTKANGDELTLTFFEPKQGITRSWVENTFLPAAEPVLGITEITDVYYLNTSRVDVT